MGGGSIPTHMVFEHLANLSPHELQKVESKTEAELKEFGTSKLEGSLPSCKDGNKGLSDRSGKIDIMAAIRYLINKNYIRKDVEKQGEGGQPLVLYSLGLVLWQESVVVKLLLMYQMFLVTM